MITGHVLSDEDEALVALWKGKGLGMYRQFVVDDESVVHFVDGDFQVTVEGSINGAPLFTHDARTALQERISEYERTREAHRA